MMKRSVARYFSGVAGGTVLPFDGSVVSYHLGKTTNVTQVFVTDFTGQKVTAPSLSEFQITGANPGAYADGAGNIVLPPLSAIEYVSALGADLGTITGEYEIHGTAEFTSLVTTGPLDSTPTEVVVGLVGPFHVRYRLASSKGIFSTWFTDVRSPFMDPQPIIGAGAVAPAYTASESSALQNNSDLYGVTVVFDNLGTASSHTANQDPPHWYRVDFQDPHVITSYKLWGHFIESTQGFPTDYELQGSNDGGSTWTAVDTQVNNPPPTTTAFPFNAWVSGGEPIPHLTLNVQSPGAFTSYRFYCTAVASGSILRVRELQLIGFAP